MLLIVYAIYGVVLFELLCGRKAIDPNLEEERLHLISWASKCKQEGTMNEIIDPYLMGKIAPECFKIYVGIASSCVRIEGKDRPAMGEVEVGLEHALQLQESADAAREEGEYDYPIDELTCSDSPIQHEMNRYNRFTSLSGSDITESCYNDSESPEMINTGAESL
nr:receptor-like protein kinase FERONIA [Quercus suber]